MKKYTEEASVPGEGYTTGYPAGNIERWGFVISSYLPQAWQTLMKTIDPLIYASLIELLGNNTLFQKSEGVIAPVLNELDLPVEWAVKLTYKVPDFIGFTGSQEAIVKDQTYLLNKLKAIESIAWTENAVKIETATGTVTFMFTMQIGYN